MGPNIHIPKVSTACAKIDQDSDASTTSTQSGGERDEAPPSPADDVSETSLFKAEPAINFKGGHQDGQRLLDGMTSAQEVCNAATMSVSSVVVLWMWLQPGGMDFCLWRSVVGSAGPLFHLPFSMMYHILLAQRKLEDAVDCLPRRLDQTCIHITCMGCLCALSTSMAHALTGVLLNLYFIRRLWACEGPGALERMINIGIGCFYYGAAGLLNGDYWNFICGACYFLAGAGAMILRLGGWGHSVMHLCLGGLTYHVISGVGLVGCQSYTF